MYEFIKEIGSKDHCPWHKNTDILPTVIQVILLQYMVQESQSPTFSSHRTVAYTCKPDCIVVCLRRILRHDTQGLVNTIVVNEAYIGLADIFNIRIVLNLQLLHMSAYCEQTACKEPFR